jgi:hypothetical protein
MNRLALLLLCVGCSYTSVPVAIRCDIALTAVEPVAARPGELVVITGSPLTEDVDTAIYVGGVRAALEAVDRAGCDEAAEGEAQSCDRCKLANDCVDCIDCDDCDALCTRTCVESASFYMPALPAGAATIELFNGHGQSNGLTIEVLGESDTGG